jgi:hypothetical protein
VGRVEQSRFGTGQPEKRGPFAWVRFSKIDYYLADNATPLILSYMKRFVNKKTGSRSGVSFALTLARNRMSVFSGSEAGYVSASPRGCFIVLIRG